jgi:type IV pilus assembly protein PilE
MIPVAQGRTSAPRSNSRNGFTLLELLIAMLILGILLGIALPSYQRYVQRGQRAEAVRLLLATAACQEHIRSSSGFYDTTRCTEPFGIESYRLRIEPAGARSAVAFTLTAEPRSIRADDACGALSLDQAGTRSITGDDSALAACWGGR